LLNFFLLKKINFTDITFFLQKLIKMKDIKNLTKKKPGDINSIIFLNTLVRKKINKIIY